MTGLTWARERFDRDVDALGDYLDLLESEARGDRSAPHIRVVQLNTMKATGWLILYNLIEATVLSLADELTLAIANRGPSWEELSDKYQELWLAEQMGSTSERKAVERAMNAIRATAHPIEMKCPRPNGGNLCDDTIERYCRDLGIRVTLEENLACRIKDPQHRPLKEIKRMRNRLAHGNDSFWEVGKDLTGLEFRRYLVDTVEYLKVVIFCWDDFIRRAGFLRQI